MPKVQIPIDLGYYLSDSLPLAAQECVNLYPQNPQTKGASATGALFRTPGISKLRDVGVGVGKGRGFHVHPKNHELFIVTGNELWTQTTLYNPVLRGIISGSGTVSMASNGDTICIIVPGVTGYFFYNNILTEISDSIFNTFKLQDGGVTTVTVKDSRFVYTTDEEFFIGSVVTDNNGQSFNALDFEDADVTSDPIVRGMTIKNELYMFGTDNIEIYQSVSGTAFPFQRILGATIEKGLTSRFSLIEFDNSFLFLGNALTESPAIWRGQSGYAEKISTSAIDLAIQKYSDVELSTVVAWTYSQDGNTFAGFTFPNETFVYDSTASTLQQRPVWHQRKTNDSRWRVTHIVTNFGEVIVDDNVDGRIGLLNRRYTSEYDLVVNRTFVGMYIIDNNNTFVISSVELSVTSGSGNPIVDVISTDPLIEMLYSINGGRSYNSMGTKKIGKDGEYNKRPIWNRLGRINRSIVFKFILSEQCQTDFQRLDIDIK